MNMKRYIAMAAVAMMFAACTNDDMPASGVDAMTDKPVLVNAGVAELVTRAGMTSDDLSTLGINITNAANSIYSYDKVKFVKDATTTGFTPAEGEVTPLWQNATQEVAVSAWSPYVEEDIANGYAFSVYADQTTPEASRASDFLWVNETVDPDAVQTGKIVYNGSDGSLEIKLQHAMSKLVVNIRLGTEMTDVGVENVVVKNLENACLLNIPNCTMAAPAESTKKDIFAYKAETAKSGYDVAYEVIFPPQEIAFAVMIEMRDGRKFLHENVEYEFMADYQYELDMTVGKDKIVLAGGESGITASAWGADPDAKENFETE